LRPNKDNWWELAAVFNPAILYDGNKLHILYRAIAEYEQYLSRFGYAYSIDGFSFVRKNKITFPLTEVYEKYGTEDPRLVTIDNHIFLICSAFRLCSKMTGGINCFSQNEGFS
jgi:predicted GH43/DUF377 family glycosyl hydrolase